MKLLKQLEDENGRLKKIIGYLMLDREMLQDVIRHKLRGVPPLKWPSHWDMIIPNSGGSENGREAREAGRHSPEVAAG